MEQIHFGSLISHQARIYGDKIALCSRKTIDSQWRERSWNEFSDEVDSMAAGLLALGIKEQDRVAQFSQNMAENLIVDYALFSNRAIVVPIYPTSTLEQVNFIVNDAGVELIFVGEQCQYDIAAELAAGVSGLKKIIVFSPDVVLRQDVDSLYYTDLLESGRKLQNKETVEQRRKLAVEDDLACILYTSGTTGNPKGVMLPHSCMNEAMRIHVHRFTKMNCDDVSIAFLPLTHVLERTWCYLCLFVGIKIYVNLRPTEIQQTIKDVRPTLMTAVPRFWEKVYAGIQENLATYSPAKLNMVNKAIRIGKIYNLDYLRNNKKPGFMLRIKYKLSDRFIFSKVKNTLGIENGQMFPTAGAKLSDYIAEFFISLGIPIVYGYGLTESTATITCYEYTGYEIGTVGSVMPDIQVKIDTNSEILVKGKTIFRGYYNNPEANKAAFTDDGWFRTGDAGFLKDDKIVLTDRIKDLFKTSNGKYIAPQEIESRLGTDKYIEQVAVIGDQHNFVTALVVPSLKALVEYANQHDISFGNEAELLSAEEIYAFLMDRIVKLQQGMANYEIIKKIALIGESFSIENGQLTNTLKLKRSVIAQKYSAVIEKMYSK